VISRPIGDESPRSGILGHNWNVREGTVRRVGALVTVSALIAAGGGGCSLGFDTFDPVAGSQDGGAAEGAPPAEGGVQDGAGSDASSSDDSSAADTGTAEDSAIPTQDAGCPGQQSCLSQATSCGMPCVQTYMQCTGMCMGGNQQQCRNMCRATEQMCRGNCAQTCVTCTTQAGCTDNQGCTAAAQM
jgi:hypothetical protein